MEEHEGGLRPKSERSSYNDAVERLARLQLTLTNLLRPVEDDARLMDASLEDAHELTNNIRSIVKQLVFNALCPPNSSPNEADYNAFEGARIDENDMYEIYADDLKRYQKRQRKDLAVAESDSDRLALVRRRRAYISALLAFKAQVSGMLDYVRNELSRYERGAGVPE
jgi:hypothetical protein